ncbi:MAG: NPCBM/NEW2 domain-containing protein [Planctomycetes bacterium]|nr:NPCBM/NEW2 domain-containing protein [Planctomycetota bacterium]
MRRGSGRFGAAAVLLGSLAAQGGLRGELETVDGRRLHGVLTVDGAGTATLQQATGPAAFELAAVLGFTVADVAPLEAAAPHRIWLRSGRELPARSLRGRAAAPDRPAALVAELPSGVRVELPLRFVRALRHGGSERPEPPRFARDLAAPPENDDVLFVQKDGQGHRSVVTVTGLQPDQVDFVLRGTAYEFPLAAVTAVVFGRNTGFAPDRLPRPRLAVDLRGGEQLEGRLLGLDADLRLQLDEGTQVSVPLPAVRRLAVASDRLVWLSERQPVVEQTPAFDRVWPWGNDSTPAGPGFVIAGEAFARGLGMVPRTRLTYDLGGAYDTFEARVGIDDRGGPAAHAVFRVFVDGRLAFESPPKVLGERATPVRIDLDRCQQLALEVDFGRDFDLGDFCAWADARVVQR